MSDKTEHKYIGARIYRFKVRVTGSFSLPFKTDLKLTMHLAKHTHTHTQTQ